ncbi:MAG TPA: hydrolase [Holophagaceae bacterium]
MTDLILDSARTAVVVIDLQKGIVANATQPHAAATVVANAVRILRAARAAGATVVLVHVGASPDGRDRLRTLVDEVRPVPSAPDWSDLIPELEQAPSDLVMLKRQWGAFYGTDLELQLRRRGLGTVVLCGIATEYGVESTAREAWERGFHLVFAADAMGALGPTSHEHCLTRIFPRLGRVRDTAAVVAALGV